MTIRAAIMASVPARTSRSVSLRRVGIELAAVLVPAFIAVLGVPPFSWSVPAALIACALLPLRHLWPPLAVLGVLAGLAGGLGWAPTQVALYALGRRSPSLASSVPWLLLASAAALGPVLVLQRLGWEQVVLTVAYVAVNVGAPTAMGMLVGTRARLVASLRELDRVRESAVEAREDAARAQERSRIGREIHDAVGHHITLIAVGAAALAASTREDDTRRAAEQMRTLAKRSLGEVRTAIGLGGGPADQGVGVAQIEALVAESRAAGVGVELVDRGLHTTTLCPVIGRAAYRVVQESLTNAARHAPGAPVRVEIVREPETLRVRVENSSAPYPREVVGRGGAGLIGLAERVSSVGGQLEAGPRPDGGFLVEAVFPLAASSAEHDTPAPVPVA